MFGSDILYDIDEKITVFNIVSNLLKILRAKPENEYSSYFDDTNDFFSKVLILVNEREISALEGKLTKIKSGDTIVFLPIIHGG